MTIEEAAAGETGDLVEHGDGTVELVLADDLGSARLVRKCVQQRWDGPAGTDLEDVQLIATELVANAVRHGRPEIVFRLRVEPGVVDVAVLDHGAELPAPAQADDTDTSGRGLVIVDRLAREWGVDPLPAGQVGKTVWASVAR